MDTETCREESHVRTKAESGIDASASSGCQGLLTATRSQENARKDYSREPAERINTLISDFCYQTVRDLVSVIHHLWPTHFSTTV